MECRRTQIDKFLHQPGVDLAWLVGMPTKCCLAWIQHCILPLMQPGPQHAPNGCHSDMAAAVFRAVHVAVHFLCHGWGCRPAWNGPMQPLLRAQQRPEVVCGPLRRIRPGEAAASRAVAPGPPGLTTRHTGYVRDDFLYSLSSLLLSLSCSCRVVLAGDPTW